MAAAAGTNVRDKWRSCIAWGDSELSLGWGGVGCWMGWEREDEGRAETDAGKTRLNSRLEPGESTEEQGSGFWVLIR